MASDLQINIALAKALGWKFTSASKILPNEAGIKFTHVFCNKNGYLRIFDYCDPVVFVAICKRWGLVVSHSNSWDCYATVRRLNVNSHSSEYVEKAAALCVIDLVKLGIDKHVERTTRR